MLIPGASELWAGSSVHDNVRPILKPDAGQMLCQVEHLFGGDLDGCHEGLIELAYVRAQAEGMRRAWLALDRAATEAGAEPLAPEVWECVLPASGEVVSIVRTEIEAHHVARETEVWTLAEIAVLIERLGHDLRQIKRAFPGSAVVEVRDRDPPPIDSEKGDDPPF